MVVCYVYVKLLSLLEVKEAKMNIFCCVCVCVRERESVLWAAAFFWVGGWVGVEGGLGVDQKVGTVEVGTITISC